MNILTTICARAGSKGVKSKNTRCFCGKPLLYYTLAAYSAFHKKEATRFDGIQLALNTDSAELIRQMDGAREPYILIERAENLAGDTVSKFDVIKDTLIKTEEKTGLVYDVVLDLDLTSPIRTCDDIAGTIDALLRQDDADIAYSVTESRRSPYFNMVNKKENGFYGLVLEKGYAARQQITDKCYDMNASIYAYRREYLLSGFAHQRNAAIWVMPDSGILDIDSERDFELMEVIFKHIVANDATYKETFGSGLSAWIIEMG